MMIEAHGCKFSVVSRGFDEKPGDLEAGISAVEEVLIKGSPDKVRAIHKKAVDQELAGELETIEEVKALEKVAFTVATNGWGDKSECYIWIEAVQ